MRDAATAASSAGTSGQRDIAINREEKPEVTKTCVSLPESVETRSAWHLLSARGKENPARSSNSVPASLGTCIPKLLHVQLGTRFGVWGQDLGTRDVLGSRKGMQQLPAPPPHPQGPTRGPSRQFTPGRVPPGPGEDEEGSARSAPIKAPEAAAGSLQTFSFIVSTSHTFLPSLGTYVYIPPPRTLGGCGDTSSSAQGIFIYIYFSTPLPLFSSKRGRVITITSKPRQIN